jgi:group I intron endonuclease
VVVYKATNIKTGLAYIGITRQTLAERIRGHLRAAAGTRSNAAFHQAIREHGREAFAWEVLVECSTSEELLAIERQLIAEHGTLEHGYNRTAGGNGTAGYEFTEAVRAAIAKANRDRMFLTYGLKRQARLFHNRTGIPHTDEAKAKISAGLRAVPPERRNRKLALELWPDIHARRQKGQSFRAIGDAFGVRPETVFYFCKRHGESA